MPEAQQPETFEFPIPSYGRDGVMRVTGPTRVEIETEMWEYGVGYHVHATFEEADPAHYGSKRGWRLVVLRGARTDGRGSFSDAGRREIARKLPRRVESWINSLPAGALERARAEQLLTEPEATGELIQQLDAEIEEIQGKDAAEAASARDRIERFAIDWRRETEGRIEQYRKREEERIAAQHQKASEKVEALQRTRQEIIDRFTETNTL